MPPPRSRRAFCVATPKLSEDRGKPLLHGSRQGAYAAAVSFDEPDSALMLLSIPDGRVLSALRQPRFDDVVVEERGKAAWQTVFHFHIHVIPRYENDPLRLPWVPGPGDRAEIVAAAEALCG